MNITKFRYWDKESNKLFNVDAIQFATNDICVWNEEKQEEMILNLDYNRLNQFTGILDKNGKEIYEGDILKISIEKFNQSNNYVVKDLRDLYLEFNRDDGYYRITSAEIIGNIFENADLLK